MSYVAHFPETLFLKLCVSYCQHFINDENFRFEMSGYGKGKSHVHTARIALDWRVHVALDSGEIHNLIKFFPYLGLGHPQNRAVEKNVFASRQFRAKARPHLQQSLNA